ncbi:MAG TPA: hypothetical protein VIP46_22580 [Pyrinomonadaceae bacterium]
MQTLTPEQQAQIKSMKSSIEILRAVARNCSDLEAADEINLQCANLEAKIAVLEGTPGLRVAA